MAKNKLVIIAVFIIISFFIFRQCMKLSSSMVETVSSSVLYPLLRIQHAVIAPLAAWFERRATVDELQHSLVQLRILNEQLHAENSALKALQVYASQTDELRTFNKRYEFCKGQKHMAQVLARHFSPTEQFFLVDAGSSQGIKKDMVALYCNNIIGKVTHVYPWYCKVCLITDADCKVAAVCMNDGKKGACGIHEGCNDALRTTLRYVSHLEAVNLDNTVLSSGEGLVFPKGFALGKVVEAHKGDLFYTIAVQPLLDLQALKYCTLVAKEDI